MDRLRTCIVNGKPAYFHTWSNKTTIMHNGRIIILTVGIIEYEDGVVTECHPHEIKFTNRFINDTDEVILTTGDGEKMTLQQKEQSVEEFVSEFMSPEKEEYIKKLYNDTLNAMKEDVK